MLNIPEHVGIIMDGNRRWAKSKGLDALQGHKQGLENAEIIARHAFDRGVRHLSLFAFSSENWRRSPRELTYLFNLFREAFIKAEKFYEEGIRIRFLGDLSRFPKDIADSAFDIEERSQDGDRSVLICLNYGGRDEIVRAIKRMHNNGIDLGDITEDAITRFLDTSGIPDPDLIIRTSGEQRLSGFLLWQATYAELYFSDKLWPAFTTDDFDTALQDFASRQRRYGE